MNIEIVLQITAGALISIGFVIWMEYFRQPRLTLSIPQPADMQYENRPAKKMRSLRLAISNTNPPIFLRWIARLPAQKCHGTIFFHHLDGQNIFGRSMRIRWVRSPEPIPIEATFDSHTLRIVDPTRLVPELNWDIYPGMEELFDVVARFDDEEDCFGWSNENYFSNPAWRNPNWKMQRGRYLVKVEIFSSGRRCSGVFRLINDVPVSDFRLEVRQPTDPLL